ncbi:hypothetical protein EVJ58_g4171 [Rhodofomes roseus]|uniref:Uncharacterized protein n=1 Tax=Rhodofomes roseus TaxID=34475 RepID=A0A4Y9YHX5_9APHY|nr:hypothetical protein EVJ58_g4171 [Rhodofomes roseus]
MATYDSLHRQCRTLESLFDTKLTTYSRLASTISRNQDDLEAGGSAERWRDLEAEVDELLEKLEEINDQLSRLAEDTENPPSQSMLRAIQRHREVYQDYSRELRRTKAVLATCAQGIAKVDGRNSPVLTVPRPGSGQGQPSTHIGPHANASPPQTNVQTALDQANLLSGVRNDIDAYKSSAADSLLAERGHIDSSHRMTDDILA